MTHSCLKVLFFPTFSAACIMFVSCGSLDTLGDTFSLTSFSYMTHDLSIHLLMSFLFKGIHRGRLASIF